MGVLTEIPGGCLRAGVKVMVPQFWVGLGLVEFVQLFFVLLLLIERSVLGGISTLSLVVQEAVFRGVKQLDIALSFEVVSVCVEQIHVSVHL